MERTLELYVPIIKTLKGIRMNVRTQSGDKWNAKTVTLATALHKKLASFELIIALKVVSKIIGFTRKATVLLQKTDWILLALNRKLIHFVKNVVHLDQILT